MMHAVVRVLYPRAISLYEAAMRGTMGKRRPDYKVSGNRRLNKKERPP